jgi:hypothetical protein
LEELREMIKRLLALSLTGAFLLTGCSSEPKLIEEFYSQLYLAVEPQLDDGYTDAQLSSIDTAEERNEFFSVGYEKVDLLIQNLKVKAEAALPQTSGNEKETLSELIKMYGQYSIEAKQAIRLLSNYDNECPDATKRPAGTLPTHACGDIALTVTDLKTASLVCVYYVSAKFLGNSSGFDATKVDFLNSGMSADVISQGCDAFSSSASLLGSPHRTSRWVVPEKMQREVDSDFVIAVADGLYTNLVSDVPILEQAVYGSWFGSCSAFKSLEARLPNQTKSGNCW